MLKTSGGHQVDHCQPFSNDASTQRIGQGKFGMAQKESTGKKPLEDDNKELIHDKIVTIKKSDKTAFVYGGALGHD